MSLPKYFLFCATAVAVPLLALPLHAMELPYRLTYQSSTPAYLGPEYLDVLLSSGMDFDGDGRVDLVSATRYNDGVKGPMRLYLSLGNGRFRRGSLPFWDADRYAAGSSFLTSSDFDADGRTDLIIVDNSRRVLQVLGNLGAGNFRHRQTITPPNSAPDVRINAVAVGDFNGDGRPDLAALDRYISPSQAADGTGPSGLLAWGQPLSAAVSGNPFDAGQTRFPTIPNAYAFVAADFTRDGKTDLLVVNRYGQAGLTTCAGNGVCSLQTSLNFDTSTSNDRSYATGVTAGDLNGDDHADALVAYYYAASSEYRMRLLRNNGAATALEVDPAIQPTPGGCGEITGTTPRIGDFNDDGKSDILSHCTAFGIPFYIAYGHGDYSLDPPAIFDFSRSEPGIRAYGLVRGDYNGDGKLDIAVQTSRGLRVFVNDPAFDRLFASGFN